MATNEKWSAEVTEQSDALDLEAHVFEKGDPREIANSLKRSAEKSDRRRSEPYRSAMSMLTFYINRAGKSLPAERKRCWSRRRTNYATSTDATRTSEECGDLQIS